MLANASTADASLDPVGMYWCRSGVRAPEVSGLTVTHTWTASWMGSEGVFWISLALAADAIIGNVQEKVLNARSTGAPCTNTEMVRLHAPFPPSLGCHLTALWALPVRSLRAGEQVLLDRICHVDADVSGDGSTSVWVYCLCSGAMDGQLRHCSPVFCEWLPGSLVCAVSRQGFRSTHGSHGCVAAMSTPAMPNRLATALLFSCCFVTFPATSPPSAVTSLRKAATLCLSFLVFPKPFSMK